MSGSSLIDPALSMDPRAALICARFHLRGGIRHLEKGLTSAGLTALYDSVFFAMHYYIARHTQCASVLKDTDLWDSAALFHALSRAGVFDDPLLLNRLSLIVEQALWQGSSCVDVDATLREVEGLLARLGVLRKHPEKEIQR